MNRSVNQIWLGVTAFIIFDPRPTLALQTHGPPEGLYVHQLAHFLFAAALLFLIWQIKSEGLARLPGFRQIRWACGLLVLWNIVAFLGHWSEVHLVRQAFQGQEGDLSQRLIMSRYPAWVYYVTKLDHLILVPAFFLLSCGLKALLSKTPKEAR
jgi:hypothetical protein